MPFATAAGFQGIPRLKQSSRRNSLKVAPRPCGPASVTHSGLIARLPISPASNYLLIEKRKAVSPGRPTTGPNAPRVTLMLGEQKMNNDLKQKILSSEYYKSLKMEELVTAAFLGQGWSAINGCFYNDLKENKVREIDCVATYGASQKEEYGVVRIHIVLECKTMAGYHVIANQSLYQSEFYNVLYSWFGSHIMDKKYIIEQIEMVDLPKVTIKKIGKEINEWLYPNEPFRITKMMIDQFGEFDCHSSFREANVGNVKELDNSVIWRASQSLKSAIIAFKHERNEDSRNDIHSLIERIPKNSFIRDDLRADVIRKIESRTNLVDIYHPIIVTDASLFVSKNDDLVETNTIRLSETGIMSSYGWWYDVVASSYIEKYIADLCGYYKKEIEKRKLEIMNCFETQ
jgi:hypothetical protein